MTVNRPLLEELSCPRSKMKFTASSVYKNDKNMNTPDTLKLIKRHVIVYHGLSICTRRIPQALNKWLTSCTGGQTLV